jgi:hypothetical protein
MAQLSSGTLAEQADLLTNPSLTRAMIEIVQDRGAPELFTLLPFKSFVGQSYDFTQEKNIATGSSARDPYSEDIPTGGGRNRRVSVPARMLIRNAITPKIDVVGKSNFQDQRADDMEKEAKRLARDYFEMAINAASDDPSSPTESPNLRGLEYWFRDYRGLEQSDQTFYATDTRAVDGTPENLSYEHIDELLSRQKGEPFDGLMMDRESSIAFKQLLNNMGGNVGGMMQEENFGRQMLHYDGVPIIVSDAVGIDKAIGDAEVNGTTVTVHDPAFYGFTELTLGQTIELDGETSTVDAINNAHQVEIDAGTDISDGTGKSGRVEQANTMYAVRFDPVDGFAAVYHDNRGVPADAGEYYGPIAGFNAKDMGLLEDSPRYQTRLDHYGNTVSHHPRAQARAVGFAV